MGKVSFISCFLFCLAAFAGMAQQNTDSLTWLLRKENNDSLKCVIIMDMVTDFQQRGVNDSTIYYGRKLAGLAEKTDNISYHIKACRALGYAYRRIGQIDSSFWNFHKGVSLCRPGVDNLTKASILNGIGIVYLETALYDSAYTYFLKTIAVLEILDKPLYIAKTKNNIGNIFWHRDDFKKALQYYQEALDVGRNFNDSLGIPIALINVANSYKQLGRADTALTIMNEALSIYRIRGDMKGEALASSNLAYIRMDRKEYAQALVAARHSLALNEKIGAEMQKAGSFQSIGMIQVELKNYDEAIRAFKQGLEIADKLSSKDISLDTHRGLLNAYKGMGNYKEALRHAEQMKAIKDSLFNEGKNKLIAEYEARYESEKKNKELAMLYKGTELQESELKREKLVQNMLIGGGVLLIVVSIILFRSYRLRQEEKRKLLDRQLRQEKSEAERLQELDEAKSRFFANIAHEFRTPLTLIQAPAEMIREETDESRSKEHAEVIMRNASRLLSLVNQLLDLSKLEAGMIQLQAVKDDFVTFAEGCTYAFESLAEENDIRLTFESNVRELKADFDPEKCVIILNNLISNALKFTSPFGEVHVAVSRVMSAQPVVQVTVRDSGIGMDESLLPNIFDRFFQADDSLTRKAQGTGIGLALVKELVELHHGGIEVSSSPGKGTTFILWLPQHQENAVEKTSSGKTPADESVMWPDQDAKEFPSGSHANHNQEELHEHTVLVVEDNKEVRRFIIDMLRGHYQVLAAENGVEGLAKAIEHVPDLIISDVMMPEMDGYTYCREIKNDDRTSHIPIILLTAKAGTESRVEGLEIGADDFLSKPFHGKELLARIKNLIHIRKQLQRKYCLSGNEALLAKKENKFITQLKEAIEAHIDEEEFSVDELATAVGMSRTQIHRKLKALTDQSTTQFVRQYKLEKALVMLRTRDYNVSEVAFSLGFNSLAYFSTSFTQHFGYTPSEASKKLNTLT